MSATVMTTKKRVLLFGYYGMANAGDDVLSYVCIEQIHNYFNGAVTIEVAAENEVFKPGRIDVCYTKHNRKFARLRAILNADILFFGGGGIFQDYRKTGRRDIFEKLVYVMLARALGKKVSFVGISVGPLATRPGQFMSRIIFKLATYISVRDSASYALLQETFGIRGNLFKSFDLALNMSTPVDARRNDKSICVSLVPMKHAHTGLDESKLLEGLAVVLTDLIDNHGYKVRLLEFNKSAGDIELIEQLTHRVSRHSSVEIVRYDGNPLRLIEAIASCCGVIATRLHAAIFAYMTATPFVVVNYHVKCENFAVEVGLNDSSIIRSDREPELRSKIAEMLTRQDSGCSYDLDQARREAGETIQNALTQ